MDSSHLSYCGGGGKRLSCHALPARIDESELMFTEKMRMLREMYGQDFYVDLLVPNQVYKRVKDGYPYVYDEIYVGADIPKLLYELKNG